MRRILWLCAAWSLLWIAPGKADATLFFDDFEHGVSRDVSGGTWARFDDGSFFGDPQWLDAYTNHNHTPGGVWSARAVEANPWVYNSYADFGATGGALRATVYLFEDKNYVPPYQYPFIKVTNMFSLWGDHEDGPEAYADYIQLGIVPTFPGGGTTYGIRTKHNDDNSLGMIDTGVERKESDWLKLMIEVDSVADGGEVRFFIDDVPVGTSQRSGVDLRWVMMGGTTYTYENFWYDDISVVSLNGDYNGDGSTDAADYVVWRKSSGNNQAGYDTWRANFGATGVSGSSTSLGGSAVVPEPTTLWALTVTGLALLTRSRRRSR